jgi:hypothetical protein
MERAMHTKSIFLGAILVFGLSATGGSAQALPWDQVNVTLKEPVGDRFIGVVHAVMGTSTVKKTSQVAYTFRIGPRGNQNDYAVFFAHLPYVKSVEPLPRLSAAERELPNVIIQVDPNTRGLPTVRPQTPQAPRGYVPGQILVKPKANIAPQAIADFNKSLGVTQKERIEGIDVYLYALPPNMSVDDARRRYMDSGLFQYAEPNRVMSLPTQPGGDPNVPDNAGPGIYMTPKDIVGNTLLVRYRSGGPTPELINQVYGTRAVDRTDADEVRLALPNNLNPLVAARIFRLCPWVSYAEPAYGR